MQLCFSPSPVAFTLFIITSVLSFSPYQNGQISAAKYTEKDQKLILHVYRRNSTQAMGEKTESVGCTFFFFKCRTLSMQKVIQILCRTNPVEYRNGIGNLKDFLNIFLARSLQNFLSHLYPNS